LSIAAGSQAVFLEIGEAVLYAKVAPSGGFYSAVIFQKEFLQLNGLQIALTQLV
jgi:hypothetical protein